MSVKQDKFKISIYGGFMYISEIYIEESIKGSIKRFASGVKEELKKKKEFKKLPKSEKIEQLETLVGHGDLVKGALANAPVKTRGDKIKLALARKLINRKLKKSEKQLKKLKKG